MEALLTCHPALIAPMAVRVEALTARATTHHHTATSQFVYVGTTLQSNCSICHVQDSKARAYLPVTKITSIIGDDGWVCV